MGTTLQKSRYRWVVLAIYMLVSALSLMFWVNFAAIETFMEGQQQLSPMQTVWLAHVFLVAFVLLTLPSGAFIDKRGYKVGIGFGVLLTGLFPLLKLINPSSYTLLLVSQIGIGCGQPFILNGITKIVDSWFPINEKATAIGLATLSQTLGMIVAFALTSLLVQRFGFAAMLGTYSVIALLGCILFFMLVPAHSPFQVNQAPSERQSLLIGIKSIIRYKNFNILSFIVLIIFGVITGLLTRLQKIVYELHDMSLSEAGNLVAIFLLAGIAGALIIPIISDKIKKRKILLSFCLLVTIFSMVMVLYANTYLTNIINGSILGFFLSATVPLLYTMSAEITGVEKAGISVGYLQLLGCSYGVIIVPLMHIIWIMSGHVAAPIYFIIGCLVIAFVLSMLMKETYPKDY